ncbi:VOC family protein [Catenulispora yoronensis]|uniref:VOC family protein n=1 Tax=Catenulispora yoronensis TaxID=450799 RepID=A0ABP5FL77_9ACTN
MSVEFNGILVGSLTPASLAAFWGQLLDLEVFEAEQHWYIEIPPCATRVSFRLAPERGIGNFSLELITAPGKMLREQVNELIAKGAVLVQDRRAPLAGWATLADPEGNEFLVLPSADELREAYDMVEG